MSEAMEELARRLVVGRKRDGRAVYDEQAKAELVAACKIPGASVSWTATATFGPCWSGCPRPRRWTTTKHCCLGASRWISNPQQLQGRGSLTAYWVAWFNNHRLLEPIGYIPPAEAEANYYAQLAGQAAAVAA